MAARAAAVTHGHPTGFWSAAAMAAIVRRLVGGAALAAAAAEARALVAARPGGSETAGALAAALDQAGSEDREAALRRIDPDPKGPGWTGEGALGVGLFAALSGASFAEALAIAANHDGDSDSTASIAGQLYGAWRGSDEIPQGWVSRLDVLDPLLELAADFLS
jgi:ADP-ribosylglycohydrolase